MHAHPATRRRSTVLVVAVALSVAAGACASRAGDDDPRSRPSSSQSPSQVRWGNGDDTEFGVRIQVAKPGRPWSEGGFVLCVTGTAPAQVTGLRFAKGSGITVGRYAVRQVDPERSTYLGSQPGSLTALRFIPTAGPTAQISSRCGANGPRSELGFEAILASGRQAGRGYDLRVQYHSLSRRGEVKIPFELQMCQRGTRESFCG